MQRYTVYSIWKLLYMFRMVPPPIIRSANNCIYSIRYLSHCYCYLRSDKYQMLQVELFTLLMMGGGTIRNM